MSTASSPIAAQLLAQLLAQLEKLLKVAADNGATEVRLSGGAAPMLRINDQMRPLKTRAFTVDEVAAIAAGLLPPGGDPARFAYSTALGAGTGALLDVQGTKVLVLRPAADAPPPAEHAPLELDLQDDTPDEAAGAADEGGSPYAMPKAARSRSTNC
jgi:hypothetical protein